MFITTRLCNYFYNSKEQNKFEILIKDNSLVRLEVMSAFILKKHG